MLGHKTFVCFRCHGSWKIFLQGMILSLYSLILRKTYAISWGSLSRLHFNLTGGSFPDISVSTGISAHTHPHSTVATKECEALLRWAGGGRQLGEEVFPCHSSFEISLEWRGNHTKAKYAGSELLPAGGLCVSRAEPQHPPATTLEHLTARCCKRDSTSAGLRSLNLALKTNITGLFTGQ